MKLLLAESEDSRRFNDADEAEGVFRLRKSSIHGGDGPDCWIVYQWLFACADHATIDLADDRMHRAAFGHGPFADRVRTVDFSEAGEVMSRPRRNIDTLNDGAWFPGRLRCLGVEAEKPTTPLGLWRLLADKAKATV